MSSPEDHAIVQMLGREFADDFYGRLNTYGAVRYVADMFAERARFFSVDVSDNKPAVGRTDAINALRQFCRAFGGRGGGGIGNEQRRRIVVLSVSAYKHYDDDDDDDDYKNGRRHYDRFELIVHAEWTSPSTASGTCSTSPTPFVQTFLVRRPFASDGGAATAAAAIPPNRPLEILKSVVKLMPTIATVAADLGPTTITDAVADLRLTNSDDIHSEGENKFVNTPKVLLTNGRISCKKKITASDQELKLPDNADVAASLCPVTTISSRLPSAVSSWPAYGGKQAKGLRRSEGRLSNGKFHHLEHLEHEAYERRIETFLKSDYSQSSRLCVYDLNDSFTVNDLYTVFGRYGTVLWARMVPTKNKPRARAMSHRQKARLEGHVCMERADAAQRILDEHRHQHDQILIKDVRFLFRKFVE